MISNYLIENSHVGVKRTKHGIFMFNRNDLFIGRSLDIYGEWCEPELTAMESILRVGDTVIDVGANIGTHAIAFSHFVGKTGKVIAFEPQRHVFQLLCGNAAINATENIHCFQKAVGDCQGSIHTPIIRQSTLFNYGAVSLANINEGEKVDLIPLDSLNLDACRLIKIDVEGMEPKVIEGAQKTIKAFNPFLFVECNTTDDTSPTITSIFNLGYKAWWHISAYFNPMNFYGNQENIFLQYQPEANLLCVHERSGIEIAGLPKCIGVDDNWQKCLARVKNKTA
jgi:FkbM family methyltransferase